MKEWLHDFIQEVFVCLSSAKSLFLWQLNVADQKWHTTEILQIFIKNLGGNTYLEPFDQFQKIFCGVFEVFVKQQHDIKEFTLFFNSLH